MNYPDNYFHFRQDSSFLYFWGHAEAGLAAVIDVDQDQDILYAYEPTVADIVWTGPQPSLSDKASAVGASEGRAIDRLVSDIQQAVKQGRQVHFLPQYRADNLIQLEELLGIRAAQVNHYTSRRLIEGVIAQRSIKTDEEIAEIEKAIAVSYDMHTLAMRMAKPGIYERDIAGAIEGVALAQGQGVAFPVILSVHGETLHNHSHENLMQDGDIFVCDSGAISLSHYASDITRTNPVGGAFSTQQREIYQIVLDALLHSNTLIKPGVPYKDVHLAACRVLVQGLKDVGLMKGDVDEAVASGAHALFMPHGLGHMMGLDVHDMEGLGEDLVGYDDTIQRSSQFGLAYLRLGKALQQGYVITVEPGCYFIPELIDQWKDEQKAVDFINYDRLDDYRDFGGIRIEDDVLVTERGCHVLGKPIPKTVEDVEEIASGLVPAQG